MDCRNEQAMLRQNLNMKCFLCITTKWKIYSISFHYKTIINVRLKHTLPLRRYFKYKVTIYTGYIKSYVVQRIWLKLVLGAAWTNSDVRVFTCWTPHCDFEMKNSNQSAVPLLGIYLYIWDFCVKNINTISFLSIIFNISTCKHFKVVVTFV